jgi:hypothetical protein
MPTDRLWKATCATHPAPAVAAQVSTPQLSLLETALGTMGRVEVYIMMRYGRNIGESVFEVSSTLSESIQPGASPRAALAVTSHAYWPGHQNGWLPWCAGARLQTRTPAALPQLSGCTWVSPSAGAGSFLGDMLPVSRAATLGSMHRSS